jgi:hypothetical protein
MVDLNAVVVARKYGEVRYGVVSERTGDLSRVLGKFGLTPDASLLVEVDRETASDILQDLLWKDMAYDAECMHESEAGEMASALLRRYGESTSRFFSNRNRPRAASWNPLTEATFDGGLLITGDNGIYRCIWFEDED